MHKTVRPIDNAVLADLAAHLEWPIADPRLDDLLDVLSPHLSRYFDAGYDAGSMPDEDEE